MFNSPDIEKFVEAWGSGQICLHLSDTLPGLSFNPWRPQAALSLAQLKGRPESKTPLALISNWKLALRLWKPLPEPWPRLLPELWPGPLTVIWEASPICPPGILAEDETVGLRCPLFLPELEWMKQILELVDEPFPSTSVNDSGTPPLREWREAVAWASQKNARGSVYVPELSEIPSSQSSAMPSTLIKINQNGGFALLRQGAMDSNYIMSRLRGVVHARNF